MSEPREFTWGIKEIDDPANSFSVLLKFDKPDLVSADAFDSYLFVVNDPSIFLSSEGDRPLQEQFIFASCRIEGYTGCSVLPPFLDPST